MTPARLAVLLTFLTAGPAARAADPPKPVKVFVLAGQSNMEGQAVADLGGKDYNDGKGTLKALLDDPASYVLHGLELVASEKTSADIGKLSDLSALSLGVVKWGRRVEGMHERQTASIVFDAAQVRAARPMALARRLSSAAFGGFEGINASQPSPIRSRRPACSSAWRTSK